MQFTNPAVLADELIATLGWTLRIEWTPMPDAVARLDTHGPTWVLYLNPDSSAEDRCWALNDVLRVVERGSGATQWAIPAPRLPQEP